MSLKLPRTKTNNELTAEDLAARLDRIAKTRLQIISDQTRNAKRDKKATRAEQRWLKKTGG